MSYIKTAEELKRKVPEIERILRVNGYHYPAFLEALRNGIDLKALTDTVEGMGESHKRALLRAVKLISDGKSMFPKWTDLKIHASPEFLDSVIGELSNPYDKSYLTTILPYIQELEPQHIKNFLGSEKNIISMFNDTDLQSIGKRVSHDPEIRKRIIDEASDSFNAEQAKRISKFLGNSITPEEADWLVESSHGKTSKALFDLFGKDYNRSIDINNTLLKAIVKKVTALPGNRALENHLPQYQEKDRYAPRVQSIVRDMLRSKEYQGEDQRAGLVKMASYFDGINDVSSEDVRAAVDHLKDTRWFKIPKGQDIRPEILDTIYSASRADADDTSKQVGSLHHAGHADLISKIAEKPNSLVDKTDVMYWLKHNATNERVPPAIVQNLSAEDLKDVLRFGKENGLHSLFPYKSLPLLWQSSTGQKLQNPEEVAEIMEASESILTNEGMVGQGVAKFWDLDSRLRQSGVSEGLIRNPQQLKNLLPQLRFMDVHDIIHHPQLDADVLKTIASKPRSLQNDKLSYQIERMDGTPVSYNSRSLLSRMLSSSGESTVFDSHGTDTDVKVGSSALRKLRDYLEQKETEGVIKIRPEDLPKGENWNTIVKEISDKNGNVNYVPDWNPLRGANGLLSKEKVDKYIESMSPKKVKVVIGDDWEHKLQNDFDIPNHVLQINLHPETIDTMKKAGVWEAFNTINTGHADTNPAHPASPVTIGWIRYNTDAANREIFVSENQNDLHGNYRSMLNNPEVPHHQKEKLRRAWGMIFGKHNPAEFIYESAMQHFRNKGMHDHTVQIHGVDSKAVRSLSDQDEEKPAHFKETYGNVPKKLGAKQDYWGDIELQQLHSVDDKLDGMKVHSMKVRKFEELLLDLTKGEW